MSGRDLGSLFEEEGQGSTPSPSDAPRPAPVEESLINDEARQMLEERSRAAREAAARAAGVAAQKGKEIGKAALGALGRMKEEHQRRAQARVAAKAAAHEVVVPVIGTDATIAATMSVSMEFANADQETQEAPLDAHLASVQTIAAPEPIVAQATFEEVFERPAERSASAQTEAPARKRSRSYRYVWIAGGLLAMTVVAIYWWTLKPTTVAPTPVMPAKVETARIVKPIEPDPAPIAAPSVDGPDMSAPVPVIESEPASAYGGEPAPVVESKPEPEAKLVPAAAAPKQPTPKATPKVRPTKVEAGSFPQTPKQEEQQIEQIRDFGKQLDALGGR